MGVVRQSVWTPVRKVAVALQLLVGSGGPAMSLESLDDITRSLDLSTEKRSLMPKRVPAAGPGAWLLNSIERSRERGRNRGPPKIEWSSYSVNKTLSDIV